MDTLTPFDKALSRRGTPTNFARAAAELADSLALCWAASQTVFGRQAKPEHSLAMLPQLMARADAIRQRDTDEYRQNADAEAQSAQHVADQTGQ